MTLHEMGYPFNFRDLAYNKLTKIREKRIMAAWIDEVDELGKVTVLFNQTLNQFLLRKDWFDERTFEFTIESNSKVRPDKLYFAWECTSFTQDAENTLAKFEFRVNFTHPFMISYGDEPDLLKIRFKNRVFFQGSKGGEILDE